MAKAGNQRPDGNEAHGNAGGTNAQASEMKAKKKDKKK
jgi:hypothetical protein